MKNIDENGIGKRFGLMLDKLESRTYASSVSNKSADMLSSYAKGVRDIPFSVAAKIAQAAGLSLDWLATGETDNELPSDLIIKCMEGVERYLEDSGYDLVPPKTVRELATYIAETIAFEDKARGAGMDKLDIGEYENVIKFALRR